MGLPSKRRTSSQRKRRASHFALKPMMLTKCPKCKKDIIPHHACPHCGYYRGREIKNMAPRKRKIKKAS